MLKEEEEEEKLRHIAAIVELSRVSLRIRDPREIAGYN